MTQFTLCWTARGWSCSATASGMPRSTGGCGGGSASCGGDPPEGQPAKQVEGGPSGAGAFRSGFGDLVTAALAEAVRSAGTHIEVWFQDEARVGQQAAARPADGLALSPPFAPVPCWWTRTMAPSTMAYSKSGSPDRRSNTRSNTALAAQRRTRPENGMWEQAAGPTRRTLQEHRWQQRWQPLTAIIVSWTSRLPGWIVPRGGNVGATRRSVWTGAAIGAGT